MTPLEWRIQVEGAGPAEAQMAYDAARAETAALTLRLFRWDPPAVSLGWKQPRPAWAASRAWQASGCQMVERPTGGGLAVHGSDVSVAVTIPRMLRLSLEAMLGAVCESAARLCREFGAPAAAVLHEAQAGRRIETCLTEPSPYAVMAQGRKVAGFALRRYPATWLIQGSLWVRPLPQMLAAALPAAVTQQLAARAIPLTQVATGPVTETAIMQRWADAWVRWWTRDRTRHPEPMRPRVEQMLLPAGAA